MENLVVGKMNGTGLLLEKINPVPGDFQLSQQPVKRCFLVAGLCIVGNGMQAGLNKRVIAMVIGVETAEAAVLFYEDDSWDIPGQANSGG